MPLPRLTGALRAFSSVSAEENSSFDIDLVTKRQRQAEQKEQNGVTWQRLRSSLEKTRNVDHDVVDGLRELAEISRELVGADAVQTLVESTAVFLFETFKDCERVSQKESSALKRMLGPFPASVATKACGIVQSIVKHIPEKVLINLFETKPDNRKQFGENIHFSYDEKTFDLSLFDEESDDESAKFEFDMKYSSKMESKVSSALTYDLNWLRSQVKLFFGDDDTTTASIGLTVDDLCVKILSDLKSPSSNDELQDVLFGFLGFERFEFIQNLLTNRKHIVEGSNEMLTKRVVKEEKPVRPNYGAQVTVQSSTEKALSRQIRRDEKKIARKVGKHSENVAESVEEDFNPQYLKVERERALRDAKRNPLLSKRSSAQQPQNVYPYVFDALKSAQATSSFVGGCKMILPEGHEKYSNKIYEEVRIPPSLPPPTSIGEHRVPISELDEIAQLAFKNTRALNRIQSVVCDAAYNTNENLLISAPTGAGKTNIAMLTILREIKQHIEQGVIKKDSFKIIYVAPMKALAAEMVRNFGGRLSPLGISVKELTGDMQLTKAEIMKTQMLVTTPEKWDVVTRKSTGDVALTQLVKLLIIDEVHLLHEDRGAVIESLVARTLRQVESSQSMIRIIGLSATLPNYLDVARFLNVNPYAGLFYFDGRFRPVPLGTTYIGIKTNNIMQQRQDMDNVCYEKVYDVVKSGQQVMVFVHARNATVHTAMNLVDIAKNQGQAEMFHAKPSPQYGSAQKQVSRSRNKQLRELFNDGFSIHHAGMLRQDRTMVERLFAEGHIKVLCCTATLAWGVNLPAHAVIIKGTQIYDAQKGAFKDLGILDVLQIFGRAGRPQYDTHGEGTIITTHDKLNHYLSLMTRQNPIESQFIENLADNLNAEVALGTVTNVEEAVQWLSYTYLFVRMYLNPLAYGLNHKMMQNDPGLENHRKDLICVAAKQLDKAHMIRFDERTGYLNSTDLGRTSSHFYIKYATIEKFNEVLKPLMTEADVFNMVSQAQEFEQIKVRDDELKELDRHAHDSCVMPAAGGVENAHGKVNILLQAFVSRQFLDSFSLVSDSAYVAQNAARIVRALFEVCLRRGWPLMAYRLLILSKTVDKRLWPWENPLRQFPILSADILRKLEDKNLTIDRIKDMQPNEVGHMVHHVRMGKIIKQCVQQIPSIDIDASIQPITRSVLRVQLKIRAEFQWNDKVHGTGSEPWWIWVEDPENNHIYHSEYFLLLKKHVASEEAQSLVFTIPIFEPLPTQYYVKAVSDRWIGVETVCPISFQHLILPEKHPPHTDLLDLNPLPITALRNPMYEALYPYTHFNPVQTQIFHPVYHTDHNILLGAPTGSGKTVAAEIAMFRVFNEYPDTKVVYIAPLKALVRERMADWKIRLEKKLGKRVVELTGDVTPDIKAIGKSDVIVTTPEKWDGISRSWQNRNYVKAVSVIIIDEIHLLGDSRGPVLEVIVSRTNFISSHMERKVRIVGLSTALANAKDLADWLGISQVGLFNFRPSVRPVPLEVHIDGFPGKHYCPRMATMNKPTFKAIKTHSPSKPTLIFVSSRRQTRLTALDQIAFLATDNNPKQWLHMPENEMESIISGIKDHNLKLTLAFGIGMHHAGLHDRDRKTVEELFVNMKIQVLIATSTLAWGVNFPAHLVVVKGTEFFDGKTKRYVDFPITDVLQMMGRAGRPQYDDQGVAVILVHDIKKHFYKKFLYEPFPVESNLLDVLPEHLNAEIVAGTITSKQDAMDYITWTYFFRRLLMNPSFYQLEKTDHDSINRFLSHLVEKSLIDLELSFCVLVGEDNRSVEPLTLGCIASFYYLNHKTLRMFHTSIKSECTVPDLINILANAHEFNELPVRHNEDGINSELAKKLPLEVNQHSFDDPHTKAHLLFQAHFCRLQLPSSDYNTDTKSVLDQAIRVLQAMLDVTADNGYLVTALSIINIIQMVLQGRWINESSLLTIPHIDSSMLSLFKSHSGLIETLPELVHHCRGNKVTLHKLLSEKLSDRHINEAWDMLHKLPMIQMETNMQGLWINSTENEQRSVPTTFIRGIPKDKDYIKVHADQEYVLSINLRRLKGGTNNDKKAVAPRFPKPKSEGWFMILGDIENKELLALKRVGFVGRSSTIQLSFFTPENSGHVIYTIYLMSDSYLGLDQQYNICLDVVSADKGLEDAVYMSDDD
ncbi:activating signal cointegrator 1 complex subunit 3-like [Antedon mediterranea]|uniref:activating signal cointegrator 1 complex subunit 3-like n=1 Tax=Antedon mediterranea TaxID=105859 RepID=UPI003AF7523B